MQIGEIRKEDTLPKPTSWLYGTISRQSLREKALQL
jgi:hypothetical protein